MKDRKNKIEKEMVIAMNTAIVAVGAESTPDASPGSTERSVGSRGKTECQRFAFRIHHTVLR